MVSHFFVFVFHIFKIWQLGGTGSIVYFLVSAYFNNGCALFDDFDLFLMKNHYKIKRFCENLGVIFFLQINIVFVNKQKLVLFVDVLGALFAA